MIVVVDASAVLEYVLSTGRAASLRSIIEDPENDLRVPALCDVEVAAGLRRGVLRQLFDTDRADEAITDYLDLPLSRHGHQLLLQRILALRDNFSVYDACYVALAEDLDGSLLTADSGLVRATRTHTTVEVLGTDASAS